MLVKWNDVYDRVDRNVREIAKIEFDYEGNVGHSVKQ